MSSGGRIVYTEFTKRGERAEIVSGEEAGCCCKSRPAREDVSKVEWNVVA